MRTKEVEETSETSVNELMRRALAERADWSGVACDACDTTNARVAVSLRYYDAPAVSTRLCLDCYAQHLSDAARIPESLPDARQTPVRVYCEGCRVNLYPQTNARLCADCKAEANAITSACDSCGALSELLNGMCGDCHKNNAQKSSAHLDAAQDTSEPHELQTMPDACFIEANAPVCEVCDRTATQRKRFAGVMSLLCNTCAAQV
jgi:hypothetical protein